MGRYLVLVPMALALAACGGGGGGGGALSLDPVASAAEKTAKQGSTKVVFTMAGRGLTGTGKGVFNNDGSSGSMSMDFSGRGRSLHMDSIMEGFVLYMRSPLFQSQPGFPKGKEWLEIDLQRAAKSMGVDLGSIQSMSPRSSLSFLRGSNGKPKKVGKETVRGVVTTHYSATVDLQAAADKVGGDAAKSLRKLIELTGTKTIPVDVWIDGHGLVRKESYRQRFLAGQPPVRLTEVMYGFGPTVHVEAPPSDKVFDATKYATS
jgi:hypothetical protein